MSTCVPCQVIQCEIPSDLSYNLQKAFVTDVVLPPTVPPSTTLLPGPSLSARLDSGGKVDLRWSYQGALTFHQWQIVQFVGSNWILVANTSPSSLTLLDLELYGATVRMYAVNSQYYRVGEYSNTIITPSS